MESEKGLRERSEERTSNPTDSQSFASQIRYEICFPANKFPENIFPILLSSLCGCSLSVE